jgi:hypothetical protein
MTRGRYINRYPGMKSSGILKRKKSSIAAFGT